MFLTSLRPESRFPSLTSRPSIGRHRHYDINKGYGTTSRERLQSGVQVSESTGFPKKDARLLQYFKSIFSMILHSLSSLSGSGIFYNFKKRTVFLGNPVSLPLSLSLSLSVGSDCWLVNQTVCHRYSLQKCLDSKIKLHSLQKALNY